MPLDQAWAVGGEAENSVEGARLATYTSTNGGRGVILPDDMKVSALPTPGPFVRIVSGGCVSPNDYLGTSGGGQSYAGREISSTDFPVAPTGSSGGQVKYLIWAVHDEQYNDGEPADPVNDLRDNYEWVSTLDGLTFPHVQLVRLDQPANTATITDSMLTDIREVANPKSKPCMRTYALLSTDSSNLTTTTGGDGTPTGGQTWPEGVETAWKDIKIPDWAVYMRIVMIWAGARTNGGNVFGHTWVQVGLSSNPNNVQTQAVKYDYPNSSDTARQTLVASDMKKIPTAMRGTRQRFYPRGNRDTGSDSGKFLRLDGGSSITLLVEFTQQDD